MFLSYWLYVCINLEIAHHMSAFGTFYNITQNTIPEETARKCSIFLHQLYFFPMGRSRTFFFEIRIKFHLRRAKGRGKRGVWGKKSKMRIIFAKFPLLSKIQTLSHKLLVRQTSNHHHCN